MVRNRILTLSPIPEDTLLTRNSELCCCDVRKVKQIDRVFFYAALHHSLYAANEFFTCARIKSITTNPKFYPFPATMVSIKLSLALIVLMIATSAVAFIGKSASSARRAASSLSMGSFYDITEKDAAGNPVSFSKFKGKVVYGVNVATKCGYTASGYALLSKISKMNGIEVAIFPCNQVKYYCITCDL